MSRPTGWRQDLEAELLEILEEETKDLGRSWQAASSAEVDLVEGFGGIGQMPFVALAIGIELLDWLVEAFALEDDSVDGDPFRGTYYIAAALLRITRQVALRNEMLREIGKEESIQEDCADLVRCGAILERSECLESSDVSELQGQETAFVQRAGQPVLVPEAALIDDLSPWMAAASAGGLARIGIESNVPAHADLWRRWTEAQRRYYSGMAAMRAAIRDERRELLGESELEEDLRQQLLAKIESYMKAWRYVGVNVDRVQLRLAKEGPVAVVTHYVKGSSEGMRKVVRALGPGLTFESLVLSEDFRDLFDLDVRAQARRKLSRATRQSKGL